MARLLGYTHPACLGHDTGPGHPECADRLGAVLEALDAAFPEMEWVEAPRATRGQLLRVHDPRLLAAVLTPPPPGHSRLDPDTVVSPGSPEAALRAAGAGVAATEAVMHGEADVAFCAVRPPGHHATGDAAMGFCLFDNIAVAAAHALDRFGLARVAVVDFDVHHGNGTQDIFWSDKDLFFASTHQMPLYPGTGAESERGAGNIFNAPLRPNAGGEEFRDAMKSRILPALRNFSPDIVLISAGFDAHEADPLASLRFQEDDFAWATEELCEAAERSAKGRVVSMLEGGYDLTALARSVGVHVKILMDAA